MENPSINLSSSIAAAIDVLQQGEDRGVVVVDSQNHVVGILTEGDIVRAIRQGTLIEAPVETGYTGHVQVA